MCLFKVIDRIQERTPCTAVQYRIRRMLKEDVDSELFDGFYHSKWVELLKAHQYDDGGYGRFHSRNSKIKQKFPTTECAVDSMKMLDLQRGNLLVDKLCGYMEEVLKGGIEWPDGFEKNKWYRSAQPLFVASKLSIFGSKCKEFFSIFNCWHTILKETFADGEYNRERANKTAKELLGCDIEGSYIGLNSIYLIEFFANMQAEIDDALKQNYLKWLHYSGEKIGYTRVILNQGFNNNFSELYKVYFLLSKFPCFKTEFEKELSILIDKRDQEGFWNFGKNFLCQKLSDDWRSQEKMKIDQTIMILLLYL
ncbi:hypothetical protein GND95_12000 [Defluviitalea raffinosedens]|uniref:Uncharacterized protein n=1 Tax=Defluviitalea raffinosedens TaxID=1450156 RepID=A0A7C8LCG4_9FIRM|nr:hypothetical protein [Defluviitalea raffinosedens]KAE9631243.1 hypothetical protein GND95_12000 [Defluviitalea raffinosedens]HHW68571.1 hypothetical protein [Candidatus Epulonipiscium sp.]